MMALRSDDATISTPIGSFELDEAIATVTRRLIYVDTYPITGVDYIFIKYE